MNTKTGLGFGRWGVLTCFGMAAGLSQFLWLNFAPILSQIQKRYGIEESQASLLLLVFPILYVLLSIHAGSLTDRKGYRVSLVLGTALMAGFAWTRVYLGNFWFLLFSQIGIAVAQPYVVNSISKLVLDWFEKKHEALATGLGTMGMFIGMALGLAITPPCVERYGLEMTMVIFALLSTLIFLACYFGVTSNPKGGRTEKPSKFSEDFGKLMKNRELLVVFLISFLGLGYFNGLTTWLEPILAPQGMDSIKAGIIGGVLILGGIFGSAVLPAISDAMKRRKPLLLLCTTMGAATLFPFTTQTSYSNVLMLAFAQGFFFLPAFALLLEMASELAGPKLAGSATGLLMLTGNLGGVIVIIAMEAVKGSSPTFESAIDLLMVVLIVSVMLSARLKETFTQKK